MIQALVLKCFYTGCSEDGSESSIDMLETGLSARAHKAVKRFWVFGNILDRKEGDPRFVIAVKDFEGTR